MKRIFLVMVVLAQLAVSGVALANTVTVDFSVLPTTVDIGVANSPPLTLNGVTFTYDAQGQVDTNGNPVAAAADALGIYGNTIGLLSFNFSAPANGLNFNFALLTPTGTQDYGLIALFYNGGNLGDVITLLMPNNGVGGLAYSGATFDQASMYFYYDYLNSNDQFFTVDTISYDPVPIPGALPLVGSGLLVLAGWGWRFRKN
jgi:hypothetical protein